MENCVLLSRLFLKCFKFLLRKQLNCSKFYSFCRILSCLVVKGMILLLRCSLAVVVAPTAREMGNIPTELLTTQKALQTQRKHERIESLSLMQHTTEKMS